jgi:undecaprenyl diphosphate synthase
MAYQLPGHVAVIMDGNGRWAQGRGLPRTAGHRAGVRGILEVVDGSLEIGLGQITVFAFSTENWDRDPREVACVLDVIHRLLLDNGERWCGQGIRIRWSGRRDRLTEPLAGALRTYEELTRDNDQMTLTVCVDYGSRNELSSAAAKLCEEVLAGTLAPADVTDAVFGQRLFHPDLPDVDLLIRTSGEQRLSNFLLWQSAYAELFFTDVLWPDFDRRDLWCAVERYATRDRRFGAVREAS